MFIFELGQKSEHEKEVTNEIFTQCRRCGFVKKSKIIF